MSHIVTIVGLLGVNIIFMFVNLLSFFQRIFLIFTISRKFAFLNQLSLQQEENRKMENGDVFALRFDSSTLRLFGHFLHSLTFVK